MLIFDIQGKKRGSSLPIRLKWTRIRPPIRKKKLGSSRQEKLSPDPNLEKYLDLTKSGSATLGSGYKDPIKIANKQQKLMVKM